MNTGSRGSQPPVILTPGDPAGIGPDLCVQLAQRPPDIPFIVAADPTVLQQRAALLGLPLKIREYREDSAFPQTAAGELAVLPVRCANLVQPGQAEVRHGAYVLETLRLATALCLKHRCSALVTGPISKSVVASAEPGFSGHTEWLASECGASLPVMMLANRRMRVALVTTHLPLHAVPAAVTAERVIATGEIVYRALQQQFGIAEPRILVSGLNPHAGEGGLLGDEEQTIIRPALAALAERGMPMTGPLPGDTLFTLDRIREADAFIAMYHDQGLAVIKHAGFGEVVNVTLGLPILRTSVDHGTAFDLAGTGRASDSSLREALHWAASMAAGRAPDADRATN